MKILNLTVNNFLIIGNASINLSDRGLVLVQGVNESDSSSASNGAGKSTIVDAISYCLYGDTARGVSGDAVINNKIGKNCIVTLSIDDRGDIYKISRSRKHDLLGNSIVVNKTDGESGVETTLTKGTAKLTQEVINKIIGCSYSVFISSVYSGQEQLPNLPAMTDKQLKTIVEEAAGITRLQIASDIAIRTGKEVKSGIDVNSFNLSTYNSTLTRLNGEQLDLKKSLSDFLASAATEIKDSEREFNSLRAEFKKVPIGLTRERKSELVDKSRHLFDSIACEQKIESDNLKLLDHSIRDAATKTVSTETLLKSLTNECRVIRAEIEKINERVGKPCGECGKEYCEEDIEGAKGNAIDKLKSKTILLKQLKEALEDAQNALKTAQDDKNKFCSTLIDVSDVLKRRDDILKEINNSDDNKLKRQNFLTMARKVAKSIEKSKDALENNIYEKLIASNQDETDKIINLIKSVSADLEKLEEELKEVNCAIEVFGRSGVRAHILDTVTPFLNEKTAEYLGTLTDGNITASWSTLTKSASGELKEKFGIDVQKKDGSKTFFGLSGGEKRKVRLATALAFQDLVATRATKPIEFMFLDEIDDAIDQHGLERLMVILEKRGREKGTVLVISHNDLKMWVATSITVTNKSGVSEVSDD